MTDQTNETKAAYITQKDCWVDGRFYTKGAQIELSAAQAKYLIANGSIAHDEAVPIAAS